VKKETLGGEVEKGPPGKKEQVVGKRPVWWKRTQGNVLSTGGGEKEKFEKGRLPSEPLTCRKNPKRRREGPNTDAVRPVRPKEGAKTYKGGI